jgi:organic hydroperoxide reductase OsmC/OhrA
LDETVGSMARNERDKLYVSKIVLNPEVTFYGSKQPTKDELDALHHRAHEACYVANSVKAEIIV